MIMLQNKIQKSTPNWPQAIDHPYKILIIGRFRSGKPNALLI